MGKKPAAKSADSAKKEKEIKLEEKPSEKKEIKVKRHKHLNRAEQHCKVGSCKNEYRAKGYCRIHYKQWRQGKFGVARYKTCHSMDCRKAMVVNLKGLCGDHYQSQFVKGIKPTSAAPEEKATAPAKEEKQAASA